MQAHNTNVFEDESPYPASFNVAPQTFQPIVRLARDSGERELTVMRWGLIPYWSKDGKPSFTTINAKAETVTTSPTFREAMKRRRCLVPAEWFYEWKKTGEKTKQPYAIGLKDGRHFAFAGDRWKDKPSGQQLETYTIITTEPNELTEPIPVILRRQDYDRWLEPGDPSHLPTDLLRPYSADQMKAWEVGKAVGNARNNDPSLIEPVLSESAWAPLQLCSNEAPSSEPSAFLHSTDGVYGCASDFPRSGLGVRAKVRRFQGTSNQGPKRSSSLLAERERLHKQISACRCISG